MALLDDLIKYEQGEAGDDEVLALFAGLIRTGQAWQLQGHYGRTARALIKDGLISEAGEIPEVSR